MPKPFALHDMQKGGWQHENFSLCFIISLNFNPGRVSHLVASYKQFEEMGYESFYYVDKAFKDYLPEGSRVIIYGETIQAPTIEIFTFPCQKNLPQILKLKSKGTKILYIFHEPLASMKEYRKAGLSYKYLAKLWVINRISSLTVKWSDVVLLPSKKAMDLYKTNPLYKNENYHYLPLLYDDERTEALAHSERKYISYIGTVAADHSFDEYLQYVKETTKENALPELSFMIATKSDFEVPKELLDSPRVTVKKGRSLSDEEINECYSSTYVVWNAYARTTQSGVLAKSFMFGTPAIVLKKNLSEFTKDGQEVVAIDNNTSFEEIEKAILKITSDFNHYSASARKRFEDTFYYAKYNEEMKRILND